MKSQDIWTQCEGKSRLTSLNLEAWRIVEAQHVTSTRKLVDSDEEQKILEDELETVKPFLKGESDFKNLHYLLFTPFRYPPLRHGSRFGSRFERSLWYGSEKISTAQAEVAYYRLLFLSGSTANFSTTEMLLTAYSVPVYSRRGIDLTKAPFNKFVKLISSKTNYQVSQELGSHMREHGVEIFRYFSARDPQQEENIAVFTPKAFKSKNPAVNQTWKCFASMQRVEFIRNDLLVSGKRSFTREDFEVDGKLPAPAL